MRIIDINTYQGHFMSVITFMLRDWDYFLQSVANMEGSELRDEISRAMF